MHNNKIWPHKIKQDERKKNGQVFHQESTTSTVGVYAKWNKAKSLSLGNTSAINQ